MRNSLAGMFVTVLAVSISVTSARAQQSLSDTLRELEQIDKALTDRDKSAANLDLNAVFEATKAGNATSVTQWLDAGGPAHASQLGVSLLHGASEAGHRHQWQVTLDIVMFRHSQRVAVRTLRFWSPMSAS